MKLKVNRQEFSLSQPIDIKEIDMTIDEYRELTNRVFNAIRNFESCSSRREREYALSVISHVSYEASLAQCLEADRIDLEQMDFALQLVLELIQKNPIPEFAPRQLQVGLH